MSCNFLLKLGFLSSVILVLTLVSISETYKINNENPYRQRKVLDDKGNYVLEWEYRPEKKDIIFNVTVNNCKGFVGLGLAKRESMLNADFFIGGVHPDGKAYCKDMHTKGNRTLIEDPQQDWKLLEASEEKGVTCLSFSRSINTCDENDIEITENRIVILWAYGENDTLSYHYQNRGFINAYLLDPNLAPELDSSGNIVTDDDASDAYGDTSVELWPLRKRYVLEEKPTSYVCSIHKGLKLPTKHHIVGFSTYLENDIARKHTHHLVVVKCQAPDGVDPKVVFEPFLDYPGEECNLIENRRLPLRFCRQIVFAWGVGGEPLFLDENVGINVGESPHEYFMLQTHLDNPDMRASVEFEIGIDFYVTPNLRLHDGRMLTVGYEVSGSLIAVPPASVDFNLIGQCDHECTELMLPQKGVNISSVFLHSHSTARKLRLRHFRNGTELPCVISDDNYNPTYQQYRNLPKDVTVLPGDHLVMQCELDNSLSNGTTVGGFGTHQEMCLAFIIIDTNISRDRCLSEYPAYRLLSQMGVDNVTWETFLQDRVVTSPKSLRGLTLGEVGDRHVKWTTQKREQLQNDVIHTEHLMQCPDATTPSLDDILLAAKEENNALRDGNQLLGWSSGPAVIYSGIGFSRLGNEPRLQREVQLAIQQLRNYGIQSISQVGDVEAAIMRAAAGPPSLLERLPPTGLSYSGVPPTTRFPRNEPENMTRNRNKCEEKKEKELVDNQPTYLNFSDLQFVNPISDNIYPSLPILTYAIAV